MMRKLALLACVIAALVASMSLGVSSSSAAQFCWGSSVNAGNKCWGGGATLDVIYGKGAQTGVCVSADTYAEACAPTETWAAQSVPIGTHYPWIRGTSTANFTTAFGEYF
jgi:hypothetical protein